VKYHTISDIIENKIKSDQVILMQVLINVKSIGKRKPILAKELFELESDIKTLKDLLTTVVTQEVQKYNERGIDEMLIPFLTEAEIADESTIGKVGFGRLYSEKKADLDKAIEVALEGFVDGLFKVVINEVEIEDLDTHINLQENDVLTFVRLTFLAGRMW